MDIVAIGELLIDFVEVDADERAYPLLQAQPGGAPANMLAAAAACGRTTAMIAKVGDDAFGHRLRATLRACGIDAEGVLIDPDVFTTLAFVTLDAAGERTFSFARKPGADTALRPDEIPFDLIEEARVVHFGSLSLTDEPVRSATMAAVERARESAVVSFDPNYRSGLWHDEDLAREMIAWGLHQSAIVKLSEDDAAFLWSCDAREAVRRIVEDYGCTLGFCTRGAAGCIAATRNVEAEVALPVAVEPIDTTGAGDIFTGAALSRLLDDGRDPKALSHDELFEIVRFACAMASLSTTRHGGMTSVPNPASPPLVQSTGGRSHQ